MKEKFRTFLSGMLIGIGVILPVSSAVLAIITGMYEKLISAINNLFKEFKKNFMFLLMFGLGAVISILLLSRFLEFAFDKFPIIIYAVFTGLIIGGIPALNKKIEEKSYKNIIAFILGMAIVLALTFVSQQTDVSLNNLNLFGYLKLIIIGFIASLTMIIPGISGSATLMVLGYYNPLLKVINEVTSLNNLEINILIIGCCGIGFIIGILLLSKLIEYCLKKYTSITYSSIIGFVVASIIQMIYMASEHIIKFNLKTILTIIISFTLLIGSYIISKKLLQK